MSKCQICGGESSHNGSQDGLICRKCELGTEDEDVIIWAWEAMANDAQKNKPKEVDP